MVTSDTGYNDANYNSGEVWEIDNGYDVFASDGEKVGDVQEVHPHYLVVSKGFFFPTERYVPVAAITSVQDERVSLNVTKDQIDSQGWDSVPSETTYSTQSTTNTYGDTGMDRTQTTDTLVNERATDSAVDDMRIPVMEEQLSVNKHEVRRGLVRVNKRVTEEQASVNVPLREETVHVERHAVTGDYSGSMPSDAFQETEIEIPLRGEEVDVTKRAVVREEVEIDKDVVERNQQVSDTVRREEVYVDGADNDLNTTSTRSTSRTSGVVDGMDTSDSEGTVDRLGDKLDSSTDNARRRGI